MDNTVALLGAITALVTAVAGLVSAVAALVWCARQQSQIERNAADVARCLVRHDLPPTAR